MSIFSLLVSVVLIAASSIWRPLSFQEDRVLLEPPPNLEYFSFGYQMPLADVLWLRAIQDFDYCENLIDVNLCEGNGWLAMTLDSVTRLAPDYETVYLMGGLALSILVSDYPGASRIFDKGVALYPKNYRLLYAAAYHAQFEEKNKVKAASLYQAAAREGAQSWLFNLATSLFSEAGERELAERVYLEAKALNLPEGMYKRMREKINQVK